MVETILGAILLILAIVYGKSFRKYSLKEYITLSTFVAIAVAFRVALQVIPNAKPTSFIIIMAGIIFGPAAGLAVGLLVTLLSSLMLGIGPYIIWQAFCWGIMGLIAYYFRNTNKLVIAIYGFVWGFLFGWITNMWYWFNFIQVHNFETFMFGHINSFPFDLVHAVTNFILLLAFPRAIIEKLIKTKN